jgi:glutaminyl-peptide cyclotransferase
MTPEPTPDLAVPPEDGGRLSSRLLVLAVVVQLALVGGLVAVALHGLPFASSDHSVDKPLPGEVPTAKVDRFDVRAAMKIAKQQVDAGPRPAGSATLRRVAQQLRAQLPNGHFEAVPGSPGLRNVVGQIPGPGPVLVIGAHYDTINTPAGFVGANDAAAAVGAVIEIAHAIRRAPRSALAPGVRFVLFDGEEQTAPTNDFYGDALKGSKAYVQIHAEEIRAMVLLDYIGQPRLRLPREGTSDTALWSQVRAAADRVGVGPVFPAGKGTSILDDHTPFLRAGIPAVDLIDWNFPQQHQLTDTYARLSAQSIDAVGETMVELVRRFAELP